MGKTLIVSPNESQPKGEGRLQGSQDGCPAIDFPVKLQG
jgi:hypothetical protein